mmetsp:Transcript_20617/g.23832  ORF Transcript_20617/g.23832 Transcript_20617/m.23832 type:complete len:131 (+) Transcript_20617:561-953(+)
MESKDIKALVDSAIKDLSYIKQEKQAEIIQNLRTMMAEGQVAIEVVNRFEKTLERNGSCLPDDIVEQREEARQFSKELSKKLSQRLRLDELLLEHQKASSHRIYTHKVTKLSQIISKAEEWVEEAKGTVD